MKILLHFDVVILTRNIAVFCLTLFAVVLQNLIYIFHISLFDQANCQKDWKRNGSQCFLPVYERKIFSEASSHCKNKNSTLYVGNFSNLSFSNASVNIITSSFWTGNHHEEDVYPSAKWTWLNGNEFKKWNKWKIRIIDVGCRGCAFWENEIIYLTSNCSQKLSYLCKNTSQSKCY